MFLIFYVLTAARNLFIVLLHLLYLFFRQRFVNENTCDLGESQNITVDEVVDCERCNEKGAFYPNLVFEMKK